MPGPSVRWRHDGTLLLDDDDTLLRFHVADQNILLNKAAADADLYGSVLEHLAAHYDDHVAVPQADGVAAAPLVPLDLLEAGDPRAVESARQLFARIVETHRAR